jgi:hypothetical protein
VGFIATTDRTANFSFSFTAGACVKKVSLTATGTVTGRCGLSTGVGVTGNGHVFAFVSVGTVLTHSGEVNGEVSAVADVASGSSCVTGATRFLITGAAVLELRDGAGVCHVAHCVCQHTSNEREGGGHRAASFSRG